MQLSPLETAFSDLNAPTLTGFDVSNAQPGVRIGGDKNRQMVRFYRKEFLEPVTIEAKVDPKTGTSVPLKVEMRKVEREMVEIITPGDTNKFNDRAEDWHRRTFYAQWQNYKSGKGVPLGTDLDNISWIPQSVVLELKYRGCHTLEQLADCSDLLLSTFADGAHLRDLARMQVKADQDNAQSGRIQALQQAMSKKDEELLALKARLEQLEEKLTAPEVTKKGK